MLYDKYKPKTFDDIIEQKTTIQILKKIALNYEKHTTHGIILSGPYGCGKTLLARLFANLINCNTMCGNCEICINMYSTADVIVIDGALHSGIDYMRQLIEQIQFSFLELKYRIIIIEEAHMLSRESMDVLLLTLQNPIHNTIFIFTTTDIYKITNTLKSRCLLLFVSRITTESIITELKKICILNNINLTNDIIHIIANKANGSLRQALSLLETISLSNITTAAETQQYLNIMSIETISDIFLSLLYGDIVKAWTSWQLIHKVYEEKTLLQGFDNLFYNLLLCKENLPNELPSTINNIHVMNSISNSLILQFIDIAHHCIFMLTCECKNIIMTFFYMITHVDNELNIKNYIKNYDKIENNVNALTQDYTI